MVTKNQTISVVLKTYSTKLIYKRKGEYRKIFAPYGSYKEKLEELLKSITLKMLSMEECKYNFGFLKEKNCVQNAKKHIGRKFYLTMDIDSFFDHVTESKTKDLNLTHLEKYYCFIGGIARQGLPTSPAIANMVFFKTDKAIVNYLTEKNMDVTYTRYADDLTFSYDDISYTEDIIKQISNICLYYGFKIKKTKTKFKKLRHGRVIITGVAIDENNVYSTRENKRKLRAAIHQENYSYAQGLKEWMKCKEPQKNKIRANITPNTEELLW